MTTPDPFDPAEFASVVFDGEGDERERNLVDEDPRLRAEQRAYRALRDDMRSGLIPTDLLDAMRASVLDTFAATAIPDHDAAIAPSLAAPVVELHARRRHQPILAAAAALVIVVAGAGWALNQTRGRASESATKAASPNSYVAVESGERAVGAATPATSAASIAASSGARSSAASASGAADHAGEATTTDGALSGAASDLGATTTLDQLAVLYRTYQSHKPPATPSPGSPAATTAPASCRAPSARAELNGRMVVLVALSAHVAVLDAATCSTLGDFSP